MLVEAYCHVRYCLDAFYRQHIGRHVHGLARQRKEQTQDLGPIVFEFLGGGNGRVAADAALPYCIRDFVLGGRQLGQGEVGEEQQVDQGVDDVLGQRLGLLELGLMVVGSGRLLRIGLVEEHLGARVAAAAALPASAPEEVVFPGIEVVGLVDKGQDAGEHAYAVEGVTLGRKLRVGKRGVVAQHAEARRHGKNQRLEVGEVVVARAPDVGGREEREDILCRLGQLPELWQRSRQRMGVNTGMGIAMSVGGVSLRRSSRCRRRGSAWAPPGGRCPA